jgi:anti-sigma B factor antagonist
MKIDCSKNGGILTVSLDGRLDTTTAPAFEGFLAEQYESSDALVIDCAKLAYISSAGLRVLLSAQKKMNAKGSMKVTNVSPEIDEIFEVTGFIDILTIE